MTQTWCFWCADQLTCPDTIESSRKMKSASAGGLHWWGHSNITAAEVSSVLGSSGQMTGAKYAHGTREMDDSKRET